MVQIETSASLCLWRIFCCATGWYGLGTGTKAVKSFQATFRSSVTHPITNDRKEPSPGRAETRYGGGRVPTLALQHPRRHTAISRSGMTGGTPLQLLLLSCAVERLSAFLLAVWERPRQGPPLVRVLNRVVRGLGDVGSKLSRWDEKTRVESERCLCLGDSARQFGGAKGLSSRRKASRGL